MPPEPSCSSTRYLPMVKRRHLPCMNCWAWKLVISPSRTRIKARAPGSGGRAPAARSFSRWASRRFSSTTPLLRTNSTNSAAVEGEGIGLPFYATDAWRDQGEEEQPFSPLASRHAVTRLRTEQVPDGFAVKPGCPDRPTGASRVGSVRRCSNIRPVRRRAGRKCGMSPVPPGVVRLRALVISLPARGPGCKGSLAFLSHPCRARGLTAAKQWKPTPPLDPLPEAQRGRQTLFLPLPVSGRGPGGG